MYLQLALVVARKTPLRKPKLGEGILSIKPRPKSVCDFLGLMYYFVVLLYDVFVCFDPQPYVIYDILLTSMSRYSLLVLKVPLNTN